MSDLWAVDLLLGFGLGFAAGYIVRAAISRRRWRRYG